MSMRTLELAILKEAQEVTGRKELRMKQILEWSTGDIEVDENEVIFYLPVMKVYIALKKKE